MILKRNKDQKKPKTWIRILGVIDAFVLIFLFCVSAGYSLMIPPLVLLIGIHLHFATHGNRRLYLNLGFLLTLIVFGAHIMKTYSSLPFYYIPVAAISMLVVL